MASSFIWYELMTDDPAGAKAFYDAVIGWNVAPEGNTMPNGSEYRMIRRADGGNAGGLLTITEGMKEQGVKPGWFGYIHSSDVDASVRSLVDAGGAVHIPPTDMGAGRLAMVSDPWGAVFYMMNPVPPPDQPDAVSDVFDAEKAGHVRWNTLWTVDTSKAVSLYTSLFGWKQEGGMPMGERGDYLFIQSDETGIGAIGPALPDGDGPRWEFHIGVDDIDHALKAVEDAGGKVVGEPGQIPGGEYAAAIEDPQGAKVGIVGPRKGE